MRPLHTPNWVPTRLIKVLDGPLERKHGWQEVSPSSAEEHADTSQLHALPLQKKEKCEIQGTSVLEETQKKQKE